MGKGLKSDFLFARPSFGAGVARTLDLWGQFDDYNRCDTVAEADATAIAADWAMVGQDIMDAIEQFDPESSEPKVA